MSPLSEDLGLNRCLLNLLTAVLLYDGCEADKT